MSPAGQGWAGQGGPVQGGWLGLAGASWPELGLAAPPHRTAPSRASSCLSLEIPADPEDSFKTLKRNLLPQSILQMTENMAALKKAALDGQNVFACFACSSQPGGYLDAQVTECSEHCCQVPRVPEGQSGRVAEWQSGRQQHCLSLASGGYEWLGGHSLASRHTGPRAAQPIVATSLTSHGNIENSLINFLRAPGCLAAIHPASMPNLGYQVPGC